MTSKVRELRDLDEADLRERLESSKEELFNLRFQLATGQLDNPMRIGEVRRDVARILTILRERELELLDELEAEEATRAAERRTARTPTPEAVEAVDEAGPGDAKGDEEARPDDEGATGAPKRRRLRRSREAT